MVQGFGARVALAMGAARGCCSYQHRFRRQHRRNTRITSGCRSTGAPNICCIRAEHRRKRAERDGDPRNGVGQARSRWIKSPPRLKRRASISGRCFHSGPAPVLVGRALQRGQTGASGTTVDFRDQRDGPVREAKSRKFFLLKQHWNPLGPIMPQDRAMVSQAVSKREPGFR